MSGYQIESAHFYSISYDELLKMLEDDKTFIVYLGYENCPWCDELVPILDEVCSDYEIDIYYVDVNSEESLANKEGLKRLTEIVDQRNENDELILFFPSILFVKEGEIINQHIGTVSGHDTYIAKMTEKQIIRLKYLLSKKFKEVLENE